MREARRAFDLLRGYVNQEWDRIQGVEETAAERELAEAMERARVRREAGQLATPDDPREEDLRSIDNKLQACRILGVDATSPFETIRQAFEKLNSRADPNKFPEGSVERDQAATIQKRVNWAYQVLTEDMDVSEKRFRSLEID